MSAAYVRADTDETETKRKLTKCQKSLRYVYNKSTGQVFGRTGRSWGYLVIYFLSFYVVLAALFMSMMHIFLNNIIPLKEPKRTGPNSIIEFIPGLNVHPKLSIESGLIVASTNISTKLYKDYQSSTDKFFAKSFFQPAYTVNGVNCSDNKTPPNLTQFCLFDKSILGPCANPTQELNNGRLCFYLRINKVFGWLPDIENKMVSNDTFVHCEGMNSADSNNLGKPVYYPSSSSFNDTTFGLILNKHFPFVNQLNYTSPIVGVQFPQMTYNIVIMIQCSLRNLQKISKPVKFEVMLMTKS